MGVEIVEYKVPLSDRWVGFNGALDMVQEVFFGPCVAIGRRYDLTRRHVEVDHETLSAVADVLELLAFHQTRPHRPLGMFAFQGLHAAQFIGAQHPFPLLGQFRCLAIHSIDVLHFVVKLLVKDRRQPIAHLMGLEIALFLKASPRVGARFGLLCCAS